MTQEQPEAEKRRALITIRIFIIAGVALVASAAAALWFAMPPPDTRHVLAAPSGQRSVELSERCTPMGCQRVTIADVIQPDGSHRRSGCLPQRAETTPLFATVTGRWSAAEDSVTVDFIPLAGPSGTMTIVLADCILPEGQ
jgi:hypothetical protein